jgi:uncharacterized protein (TIGR02147 family)
MKQAIQNPNLYDFTDYRSFLVAYFGAKKKSAASFSLRAWSAKLGVTSPASLNMILRGKRNPGPELLDRLNSYFKFSVQQRKYFEGLVKLEKSKKDPARLAHALEDLTTLHPAKKMALIDFDTFSVVSNWYFFAIREMVNSSDFQEDPDWISKRLKRKISAKKAHEALDILTRTGLLTRNNEGKLVSRDSQITTNADVSNEALKRFHEEMISLAQSSVREVSVPLRDISGSTFNIAVEDLPALKEELRRVRKELYQRFERPQAPNTYQLNFQLFPLTSIENERKPS